MTKPVAVNTGLRNCAACDFVRRQPAADSGCIECGRRSLNKDSLRDAVSVPTGDEAVRLPKYFKVKSR